MRLVVVLAGLLIVACESSTDVIAVETFAGSLSGDDVRPTAVQTGGNGSLTITSKSNTSLVTYELSFAGLSSAATSAHIHGPAVDTAVAAILVDFAALPSGQGTIQLGTSGTASGEFDLHSAITPSVSGDSLFKLLNAGRLYVDVHTSVQTNGEIRGQITKK